MDDQGGLRAESVAADPRRSELSRLFIVCGRDRKVDELRALFSTCGAIKHLHLALDRSKKSRGFAFLQYEDPSNAAAAIGKLDHMKLEDGHILKVTVAKERPVGGNGKLKRNQHARQDLDDKSEGGLREDDGGIDARLPGKRQRSSPPVAALPLGSSRVTPAFLLENRRLERFGADAVKRKSLKMVTMIASQVSLPTTVPVFKDESMEPEVDLQQVEQVMRAMILTVEQIETENKENSELFAAYKQVEVGSKQKRGGNLRVMVPGSKEEAEEENTTESLASSIRSVSLAPTPMTTRGSPFDALRTPRLTTRDDGVVAAPPRSKHHLRRRRQSLDGSGSSTEDGSDGSGIRRKRSNTTSSPPSTIKAQIRANSQLLSPPRKLSDRSDISLSPDVLKAEIVSKKLCKRQSPDNAIEEPYRLAKQQATQERRELEGGIVERGPARLGIADVDKSHGQERDVKLEFKSEPAEPERTKLFFTSTYKFTEQELEAMFAVYGDFESAELVKSFGRVKTMAYIRYSKPCTAAFVVKSFREESSQGDEDPERPEFMTLSFAHGTGDVHLPHQTKPAQFQVERALGCSSNLFSSLTPTRNAAPSTPTAMSSGGKERLWVLLLYDRFLATHMLSSVVSSFSGMEFMDIKVVKSTGEAQGVAFVKFDSEMNATQAALQLHQMELPLGSGKFLQAIVILAPSLFTTTHGGNSISSNESMRLDRTADERVVTGSSEDVDLRAVEARFAHLMRSTEHPYTREGQYFHHYSSMPLPRGAAAPSDQLSPMTADVYPPVHSGGFHSSMGTHPGVEYYPMQLVAYPPPPPQQPFQPYANFGGPGNYHQLPQHQGFGGNASGWMDTGPYYQGGVPQYPFSCAPEQEMAFPVAENGTNGVRVGDSFAVPPKPRSSRSSSEQMDVEDGNSSCSSQTSSSIHVSTSEPLELVTLVSALQDCPGVVSFAKDDAAGDALTGGYMVEFTNEAQAHEALRKLDGSLCGGQKLRVVKATSATRHRGGGGGGGKARTGSGRRKRQRVDPRSRK
ncbi:hypothetical protein PC129_g1952 [Phytophthora cactorum]|uniref:RRM domain-containing protein n=1 Tax=Phytophthora cactorum TaxID=29920 RepID=A0A329SYZ5_9STRA|nr:hypothetical protein Pcac1_g20547 [Phytophthora cactorum]KAG2841378.1 hypothetical protein PC112_g3384 [Phytophthora cactorum]KAG2843186.1 hypothetical protein PC111_g2402 [Phytophthora cactorum]KAG2867975.1 hypothetical protein PC113_g1446 [Phytophthora cactorum]KAG2926634.1 hypothetical protein PC114_g3731 [Phytophthora cactorum]